MKRLLLPIFAFILIAASVAPAHAIQCVPYAREVTGLSLKGNAWEWWQAAAGVYERGRTPREGAVLVFPRQGSMRYGHVAVVTRVISNRLVLVDHANWAPAGSEGRGKVTQSVPVLDVSPHNDWSQTRVWYRPAEDYGNRIYKAVGFVYNTGTASPAVRPSVERVALTRAAAVFPNDKAFSRYAAPGAVEAAKPAPAATVVAATPAPKAPVVPEHVQSHPSTEDLVRVVKHVFKTQTADANIFN